MCEADKKVIAVLVKALRLAAADIADWGAYASEHSQQRWDLSGDVTAYQNLADAVEQGRPIPDDFREIE